MSFAIAGTVLTVGATAYGARQARRAGDAAAGGAEAASAESARQYDQTRADLAPYRTTGTGALNQLGRLFGLPTTTSEQFTAAQDQLVGDTMLPAGTTTKSVGGGWYEVWNGGQRIGTLRPGGANGRFVNDTGVDIESLRQRSAQGGSTPAGAPDMSAFFESPGYQFRRSEGTRGIERTAAARGGAFSGNALKALAEFNSNLASNEFGTYVNQLAGIAGVGQSSTNQTAAYGADAAAQQGRNALYAGDARASGIENQANIIGQGINGLATGFGYLQPQRARVPHTGGIGGQPDWQSFYFGGGG